MRPRSTKPSAWDSVASKRAVAWGSSVWSCSISFCFSPSTGWSFAAAVAITR